MILQAPSSLSSVEKIPTKKEKESQRLIFQRLTAIILLTEISTMTTFASLNMVNILPTESVEFLSLETHEIELELVLKKMIVVLARCSRDDLEGLLQL